MQRNLKRSTLVGSIRGFLLIGAIYTLEYIGISSDVYARGRALGLEWRQITSVASLFEGMLFCKQLAMIAPLGCILGAAAGVFFDRVAQITTRPSLRLLEKLGFPILFSFSSLVFGESCFKSSKKLSTPIAGAQ